MSSPAKTAAHARKQTSIDFPVEQADKKQRVAAVRSRREQEERERHAQRCGVDTPAGMDRWHEAVIEAARLARATPMTSEDILDAVLYKYCDPLRRDGGHVHANKSMYIIAGACYLMLTAAEIAEIKAGGKTHFYVSDMTAHSIADTDWDRPVNLRARIAAVYFHKLPDESRAAVFGLTAPREDSSDDDDNGDKYDGDDEREVGCAGAL